MTIRLIESGTLKVEGRKELEMADSNVMGIPRSVESRPIDHSRLWTVPKMITQYNGAYVSESAVGYLQLAGLIIIEEVNGLLIVEGNTQWEVKGPHGGRTTYFGPSGPNGRFTFIEAGEELIVNHDRY